MTSSEHVRRRQTVQHLLLMLVLMRMMCWLIDSDRRSVVAAMSNGG